MFCLACQDSLSGTNATRFPKRRGMNSIPECYKIFKREYLDLPEHKKKAKKEQVTKQMSHSIVGLPLADIPLDCIALASMHIILGFTKKIYEWLLNLFTAIEHLEEKKQRKYNAPVSSGG